MGWIEVSDAVDEQLRDLGRRWGVDKGEALLRVLSEWKDEDSGPPTDHEITTDATRSAPGGVPVYFEYLGVRNAALFEPETGQLEITAGPARGGVFTSPSSAASQIDGLINPSIVASSSRNGWITWRLVETDEFLDTLRERAP